VRISENFLTNSHRNYRHN